ncbi:sortase [Dactylosporangium sp. NPDC000555]|uniref:sortase n=1 Tax=Dactylosporangium sp. NPDC000555 TaxID=3154260 RepID=UPI0033271C12
MTALLPARPQPPEYEPPDLGPIPAPEWEDDDTPPAWRYFLSSALIVLAAVLLGLTVHVTAVSRLVHESKQRAGMDTLRIDLARATAPVGQARDGKLLPLGTPVAVLRIPALRVDEVVFEGTTGGVLMGGPGHQRDSALPGQAGTAIIMGRTASYGGPFRGLQRLVPDDRITVLTGQGEATYRVTGSRRAGDAAPPPVAPGAGRLTLVTAVGAPFLPEGVLRVDAELVSPPQPNPPRPLRPGSVSPQELPLAGDTSSLWILVMGLQGLVAAAAGTVWSRHRWGGVRTWIVFVPLVAVFGLLVAEQTVRLLPNLL